jgi:hypothetical protein
MGIQGDGQHGLRCDGVRVVGLVHVKHRGDCDELQDS